MGTLNFDVLGSDLDFLIAESGRKFVGVTPTGIADKTFNGSLTSLEEGYDVMLQGNEVTIDAEILLNGKAYSTLPTKGAVLKDLDDNHFKVLDVQKEDFGPAYVLRVMARYQSS